MFLKMLKSIKHIQIDIHPCPDTMKLLGYRYKLLSRTRAAMFSKKKKKKRTRADTYIQSIGDIYIYMLSYLDFESEVN